MTAHYRGKNISVPRYTLYSFFQISGQRKAIQPRGEGLGLIGRFSAIANAFLNTMVATSLLRDGPLAPPIGVWLMYVIPVANVFPWMLVGMLGLKFRVVGVTHLDRFGHFGQSDES